jgi:hypothetical protein
MLSSDQMRSSVPGKRRISRIIVVFLAIAAMLGVSAASLSAAHAHLNSAADQCDICHSAHMAAQQVAVIHAVHTLELQSFLAPPEAVQRVESRGFRILLTRGPPASL